MSLDERLTRAALQVAGGLTPPEVDPVALRTRARDHRRRRTSLTAAATLVAVVTVGAVVVRGLGADATDPVDPAPSPVETITSLPTPEETMPFPRSMTPEEVVHDPRALLRTVAVAPGDPDTRISMWVVSCTRPCPERGPFEFTAAALTTNGYETTTYLRPSFELGVDLQVSTPEDDVFLVSDQSNGGEWLVDTSGDARSVTRVDSQMRPSDPRLWFQCPGPWRSTWCALDPDTATAHAWPRAWDGSAATPVSGDRPWGTNPEPRATSESGVLEAWWDTSDGRQLRTLTATTEGDYILGTPPGEMAHWARPTGGTNDIAIFTSRNGGLDWEDDIRTAEPGFSGFMQMKRSPDGAYLAYSIWPRLVVWRAEAAGGQFRKVYEQPAEDIPETTGSGLWTQDDLVYANANATAAVSADDGLTWTTVRTWR
ncbi:hypothetical protein [Nocardioides terrigena]|uniref:hypothetical protein n=1 Tax=Nocardioides terrigena TaxID=424797 RepID=UPI000D310C22|nr:hypothetical protein [Nocardioides terrigena]